MSEQAVQARHGLPVIALIDMGDFAGGLLKYLRGHPIPRLTIAGGFAKIGKLAQGALDLHSGRSQVDLAFLAGIALQSGGDDTLGRAIEGANTAAEALALARAAGIDLARPVAERAAAVAADVVRGPAVTVDVMIVDREGTILAETANG